MLPDGAEFCPDCGAPIETDAVASEGSDAAIYPELARANLLRMRSEYKQAEEVCLAILRRFPNNATANTLLGDICAERGDLEQAAEWYELALDIVPDSTADRTKLIQIRQRLKEREAASTAEQLGLPTRKPKALLYAVGLIVMVVAIASASYFIGRQAMAAKKPGETGGIVNLPLTLSDPEASRAAQPTPTPSTINGNDAALRSAISTKVSEGAKLTYAWKDPRTNRLYLTLALAAEDDERVYAAKVGKAALEHVSDSPRVTIRVFKAGLEAYMGDVMREGLSVVTAQAWIDENGENAVALANALLVNEWTKDKGLIQPTSPSPAPADPAQPDAGQPEANPTETTPNDPNAEPDNGRPRNDGGAPPADNTQL